MEWRYLIGGVNVLVFAVALVVFGYASNSTTIIGIGSSLFIVGAVLTALGFSYIDPLQELYHYYSLTLSQVVERIIEDVGLLEGGILVACPRGDSVLVAYHSSRKISCSSLIPGLLVDDKGDPYIAFSTPIDALLEEEIDSLEDALSHVLVAKYGVAGGVEVRYSEKLVEVELVDVSPQVALLIGRPIDPIKAIIATIASTLIGRGVVLSSWRRVGNNYLFALSPLSGV